MKKELSKKSAIAQEIEESMNNFSFVKDEIVVNLVLKEIDSLEKEKKNYIIEGFPKTRAQGLAIQRKGIIPNAFIFVNIQNSKILANCA